MRLGKRTVWRRIMYTSGGEVILGHFLCLDVENMGLDDISWRRLHFLETWLEYGSEADCYLKSGFTHGRRLFWRTLTWGHGNGRQC